MDNISSLLFGILNNNPYADPVGRDNIGDYTIDTCYTTDQGYETAIWFQNHGMIIVARYGTREEAVIGHQEWCDFCHANPTQAWSVQFNEYINF